MKIERAADLIKKFEITRLHKNGKGKFARLERHFLVVGAKVTKPSKPPSRFEFKGIYRLFNSESLGDLTSIDGGALDAVKSDDEARLRVINRAVSEILIPRHEGAATEVGAVPIQLCIVSATPSLRNTISRLFDHEWESPRGFQKEKNNLGLFATLDFALVSKEIASELMR